MFSLGSHISSRWCKVVIMIGRRMTKEFILFKVIWDGSVMFSTPENMVNDPLSGSPQERRWRWSTTPLLGL